MLTTSFFVLFLAYTHILFAFIGYQKEIAAVSFWVVERTTHVLFVAVIVVVALLNVHSQTTAY